MEVTDIYEECHKILSDPVSYLEKEKKKNGYKYIGYTCIFAPEEIVHAAGYIPIRIMGFSKRLIAAEKFITSNCCEFARSIVEFISSKRSDMFEGFVFSHCCDTLQVVASIAPDIVDKNILIYNIPTNLDSKNSYKYIKNEVCNFKVGFENKFNINIEESDIQKSYSIYKENRRLLSKLCYTRRVKPGIISGYDSFAVIMAGMFMPKEKHNELLKNLLDMLENKEYKGNSQVKIMVSGIINYNLELIKNIEESGSIVVEDDLCEVSRIIPLEECDDFKFPDCLAKVTSNLFCLVKNYEKTNYEKVIINKYNDAKCDGIIFIYFPFCDPQFMEYAYVKRKLDDSNIKSLLVENVVSTNNFAQLQTRIEAFLESI